MLRVRQPAIKSAVTTFKAYLIKQQANLIGGIMYPRNSASPPLISVGAVVQISDGAVQTAGVSIVVRPEGGAETAGAGTLSYGATSGIVYYTPTPAETDYTAFVVVAYKTGCIPAEKAVVTSDTTISGRVSVQTNNDKTNYTISSAGIASFWSALTSGLTAVGSVGKLIADNLNAAVGGIPTNPLLANDARLANLNAPINLIPTNPLLANDSRLLNLDFPISTVYAAIGNLNNLSAKINIFGTSLLEIPDSGSTVYAFTVVVKDDEDKLVNLDAAPTITALNAAGTNRSGNLSAVSNPSTGRYTFTYSVSNSHPAENLRIPVSGTVSGEARYTEWIGSVVNYDTLTVLQAVQTTVSSIDARLPSLPAAVSDIPTANQNRDAVMNAMPNGGWVVGSFGDRWLISNNSNRSVGVTGSGSGHVQADVHQLQPDVFTASALAPDALTEIVTGVWSRDLSTFGPNTAGKSLLDTLGNTVATLARVPATTAQLIADLTLMLVGSGTALVKWTANALSLSPSAAGSGSGARVVQITVVNNLTVPIQSATVRVSRAGESFTAQTNMSGIALFSLDDATWTVSITAAGFSFAPTSLSVTANTNQTYSMTTESGGVIPSVPGSVTGYWVCLSQLGVVESGVTVNLKVVDFSKRQSGIALDETVRTGVSGSDGVVQFNNLTPGVTYEVWRGSSTKRFQVLVPTTATTPFALGNIIGN